LSFEDGAMTSGGASKIFAALLALSTAESLTAGPRIRKLNFSDHDLGSAPGIESCSELVCTSTWLQELRLNDCELSSRGVVPLIYALRDSSSIASLDLSENFGIDLDGFMAIGTFLQSESSLKSLNLGYNHIDIHGVKAIADGLKVNKCLQELYLDYTQPNGAFDLIADALRVNSSLCRLHLTNSKIDSVEQLSFALRMNVGLEYIDLDYCGLDDRSAASLGEALRVNTGLRTLNISRNKIGDAGAVALGLALGQNSTLTCLQLHHNSISDAGAVALGAAVCTNSAMVSLGIEHNQIKLLGAEYIRKAQSQNPRLEPINLEGNPCGI
jgi:Ran GTPase-activating protein (RanGAP) involved in mRNA processing and transport